MKRLFLILSIGFVMILWAGCQTQEKSSQQTEAKPKPKLEDIQAKVAIEAYIKNNSDGQGILVIKDDTENRPRQLVFRYVHESVQTKEDGRSFACVDFTETRAEQTDSLDLDFYVFLDAQGSPKVSEVLIHKVNGEKR